MIGSESLRPICSRHRWRLMQDPCIRMKYHVWCSRCGKRSEDEILVSEEDKDAFYRRLCRSANTGGEA